MEKKAKLAAGTIQVKCNVVNETIENVEIFGDFFAGKALDQLCESLVGCAYRRDEVQEVLTAHQSDNIIYGVSQDELLEAMF